MAIEIKTEKEVEVMAEGGQILAKIMRELERKVRPGIATKELDKLAQELVLQYGGKCSFLDYEGFPACICASVNEEVVHAVPSRILKEGDILSIDAGIFYKGFHTDTAITVPVGKVETEAVRLIKITKECLERGIKQAKAGNTFGDIGRVIQEYAEAKGFNVVRELCGHGIGRELHEDPQVLNYVSSEKDADIKIKEGMVFCIEPMLTAGNWKLKKSKDGFGYETKDGSLSCHFEHTVAVTSSGYQVLTKLY